MNSSIVKKEKEKNPILFFLLALREQGVVYELTICTLNWIFSINDGQLRTELMNPRDSIRRISDLRSA
jgi:hypothetical protein